MIRNEIREIVERSYMRKGSMQVAIEKNMHIVCEYFGVGTIDNPTYEKVGEMYGNLTKQRIQKIINDHFRNVIKQNDLETLKKFVGIFAKKKLWSEREFSNEVNKCVGNDIYPVGIVNLLNEIFLEDKILMCNNQFKKASGKEIENGKYFLISQNELKKNGKNYQKIIKDIDNPIGTRGLGNLDQTLYKNGYDKEIAENIIKCLEINPKFKLILDNWYIVENRNNIIVNSLEKIANITSTVQTDVLVEILLNTIKNRTSKYQLPTIEVIEEYLKNSRFVTCEQNYITIKIEATPLVGIDAEVVRLCENSKKNSFGFNEISSYLEGKGYSKGTSRKIYKSCPLLFVDRTKAKIEFYYVKEFGKAINDSQKETSIINRMEELFVEGELLNDVNENIIEKEYVFSGKRKKKTDPIIVNNRRVYKRDAKVAMNALAHAKYKCEAEGCTSVLFKRRNKNVNYTETHHLVPMALSDMEIFGDVSLDVEENIVSLCSHCHNLLHYGSDFEPLLRGLFEHRKDFLETVGIEIDIEDLVAKYR